MKPYTEHDALEAATIAAASSPCQKSKRGVVIFHRQYGLSVTGCNHPPLPLVCDGTKECRKVCNKICIHAEEDALLKNGAPLVGYEMLHVKVVDGKPVASGPPSCWRCSPVILHAKLKAMWLLHEDGLRAYYPLEFHIMTLEHHGIRWRSEE